MLVAVVYVLTLVVAADISAVDRAGAAAAAAPAQQGIMAADSPAVTAAAVEAAVTEAPLVTLGIAGAVVLAAGGVYLLRVLRRPRRRRTYLVARHVTTLT